MYMGNEVEYEYDLFLSDMQEPAFVMGTYMDEGDYEDEYSHNDIHAAIEVLEEKIRKYLQENRLGEFVLISGWNIRVLKIEEARKTGWSEKKNRKLTCGVIEGE